MNVKIYEVSLRLDAKIIAKDEEDAKAKFIKHYCEDIEPIEVDCHYLINAEKLDD